MCVGQVDLNGNVVAAVAYDNRYGAVQREEVFGHAIRIGVRLLLELELFEVVERLVDVLLRQVLVLVLTLVQYFRQVLFHSAFSSFSKNFFKYVILINQHAFRIKIDKHQLGIQQREERVARPALVC